jgi:hypothetical protein
MPEQKSIESEVIGRADSAGAIEAKLNELEDIISLMEAKVNDLWTRPHIPYTQNASEGDLLELDVDLRPQWVTP